MEIDIHLEWATFDCMYKVHLPGGIVVEAQTATDVRDLVRVMEGGPEVGAVLTTASGYASAWIEFVNLISGKKLQVELLQYLWARKDQPSTLAEMAKAVGLTTNEQVGGTLSGIRKNTVKAGFGDADALVSHLKDGTYMASPVLLSQTLNELTLPEGPTRSERLMQDDR